MVRLLEQYLRDQQQLSAVDRFAQRHAPDASPPQKRYYRDLIPLEAPAAGQQYAFRVDLDACTGCKACVTACHSLNGLDEGETWRAVGLLHGGSPDAPVQQAVTAACHHCAEPACLRGCPALAYEKDAVTGIVRHLDDQCIGCQYCTFTCPYDVPQYNAALGIVRKCDMCSDRLAASEAPACAQACPNEAITITVVDLRQAGEDALQSVFLAAASPVSTLPTTRYETARALPDNLLPADRDRGSPAPRHTSLAIMLVSTQLSVGALWASAVAGHVLAERVIVALRPLQAILAASIGIAGMAGGAFHLGRPLYAFRALLGLRTSWMSREILAMGLFAPLAVAYAAAASTHRGGLAIEEALGVLTSAVGLAVVACSVLVYHATRRPSWSASIVGGKFLLTTVVLGLATTLVTLAEGAARLGGAAVAPVRETAAYLLALATLIKLAVESRDRQSLTPGRSAAGLTGGVALPLLGSGLSAAAVGLVLVTIGEILERRTFFAAATSPARPRT